MTIAIISSLLFKLVVLLILLRLVYILYRELLFRPNYFGKTLPITLFAIGFASLFIPQLFQALFITPFQMLVRSGTEISRWLIIVTDENKTITWEMAIQSSWNFIESVFYLLADTVLNLRVFLGIILAFIIQSIIQGFFYDSTHKTYQVWPRLKVAYVIAQKRMSNKLKQNLALIILLIGSLYLVLCVTIAIPYNDTYLPDGLHDQRSDSAFKYVINSGDKVRDLKIDPENYRTDSVNLATKLDKPSKDSLGLNDSLIFKRNKEIVRKAVDDQYADLKKQIAAFNKTIDEFEKDAKAEIAKLEGQLARSTGSRKIKDTYHQQLQLYIDGEVQYQYSRLAREQYQIDATFKFFVQDIMNRIDFDRFAEELRNTPDTQIPQYFNDYFAFNNRAAYSTTITGSIYTGFSSAPPDQPHPGADWGWLGNRASWLIAPNNPDLILIIGMFGFGLLGAAISSFVNIPRSTDTSAPVINDVYIVIIRGFSAAIVIFLATKGGIAIVNNGNNTPNPHVLFFTCLVGAVFSERIWEWAKNHLSLKPVDSTQGADETAGGIDPYQNETSDPKLPPASTPPAPGIIPLK